MGRGGGWGDGNGNFIEFRHVTLMCVGGKCGTFSTKYNMRKDSG